jgi:hypothetical protein
MGVLSTTVYTLSDIAKSMDPDGRVARLVPLLSQTNELLLDGKFMEGNLPTGHRSTQETGLPAVFYRLLNQGIAPGKSTSVQVDEQCGMLEGRTQIDRDLADLNGNTAAFRLSRSSRQREAMNQRMASTMIYGNAGTTPEEFSGMALRTSSLTAGNASHILDAGGTGSDNSSIFLCGWGDMTMHMIYPKGSDAGLKHEDLGLQDAFDANNNRFRAYLDWMQWKNGLCLPDWRYLIRICNIDISNLVAQSAAADLIELMIKAIHRIPYMAMCTPVFYMNRTCFEMLDIQRRNDVIAGSGLNYSNVDGQVVPTFRGIPVRKIDALLETEARVT